MKTKEITQIGLSVALLTICSWITIPLTIPFTLQTFGIFFILLMLKGKNGTIAILSYILLGAVGVPVFSGFKSGVGALMGMTGGYIVGFLLTGLLYWLITTILGNKTCVKIGALLLGLIACYLFGTIWFIRVYSAQVGSMGVMTALSMCVFPFLIPDSIKLGLAFCISKRVVRAIEN